MEPDSSANFTTESVEHCPHIIVGEVGDVFVRHARYRTFTSNTFILKEFDLAMLATSEETDLRPQVGQRFKLSRPVRGRLIYKRRNDADDFERW